MYWRTIIQVEVLSEGEEPYTSDDLEQISYDITEGSCSGMVTVVSNEQVEEERMADLLTAQGSDPGFLIRSPR